MICPLASLCIIVWVSVDSTGNNRRPWSSETRSNGMPADRANPHIQLTLICSILKLVSSLFRKRQPQVIQLNADKLKSSRTHDRRAKHTPILRDPAFSLPVKYGIQIKYFDSKVCFLTLLAAEAFITYAQSSINVRQDTSSRICTI